VTDDGPVAACDGHDFPGLIDEGVAGIAAVIDDVVEGFEDAVRQPVVSHELPDILLAVELRCTRRQLQKRYVAGNLEFLGAVPAGLIEDEDGVSACGNCCSDLIEMKLHGFGIAERENEGGAGSMFRTYRTKQVGRLGALIMSGSGTRAPPGPAIGEFVLLADPHLVLEPDLYRCARREPAADFRHACGKVF